MPETEEEKDLGRLHAQRIQDTSEQELIDRWSTRIAPVQPETPGPSPDGGTPPTSSDESASGEGPIRDPSGVIAGLRGARAVAKDVGLGAVESPLQIVGGVTDAIGQVGQMAHEFENWLGPKLGPLGYRVVIGGEDGLFSIQSPEESKDVPNPVEALTGTVGEAETTTGNMVRNVAQFTAGFLATRGLPGVQALGAAGTGGALTANALRGAVADFSVFDPQEERLSNLVEEFPALQNPVTEFLAAQTDDGAAEGRLKSSLEGLGLGVAADGFVRGLALLRSARKARTAVEQGQTALQQVEATAKGQAEQLVELTGKPDAPAFEIRPVSEAEAATAFEAVEGEIPAPASAIPSGKSALRDSAGMSWEEWGDAWEGRFKPGILTEDGEFVVGRDHGDALNQALDAGKRVADAEELGQRSGWKVGSEVVLSKDLDDDSPRAVYDFLRQKAQDMPAPPDVDRIPGEAEKPGKVFVNWSRINSDGDLKEVIQQLADARGKQVDAAQRGTRSWRATRRSAGQIDAWDTLMSRKRGEPLNAEQTVAVRELWIGSGEQVRGLAARVAQDPSDLNKIAFRKALAVHNRIQEQVLGARTETARALNAWAIPAGPGPGGKSGSVAFAQRMEQLKELVAVDRDVEDIARGLVMLEDAGLTREADAFLYGTGAQKAGGMVRQLFYFSMLSSPHTQIRNLVGNTAAVPLQVAERKFASLLGRVAGQPEIPAGEASSMLFGALRGMQDALVITSKGRRALATAAGRAARLDASGARAAIADNADEFGTAWRAAATGETGIGINRLELPQIGAFDPERLGIGRDTPMGRVMSFLDTVTTAPMRALGVGDEVFKTTAYNMELNAQAYRTASREVAEGKITREGFSDRLAELVANPDERMQLLAEQFAKTSTFTNQPIETPTWRLARAVQNVPVMGRLVLPFRRTPYNLATFTFQRTPMAPFVRQWQEDIKAGGAAAQLAWSRMMMGTGIMLAMADLALSERITGGGPEDFRQRQQWSRTGWQPNSIKIGDRYFSYQGLEPISTPIGLAANTVDILRHKDWDDDDVQVDELVIASTMAIASQVTSQQYMMGVARFFEAMQDPKRYGERWFQNLGSLVVPRGIGLATRLEDPTLRMAEDVMDSIRRQTPGLSKDLPPMRDVWGRPIDRSSGLGGIYDFLSPQRSSQVKPEPIDAELNRLELFISRPQKRVAIDGVTVNLERFPRIYSRYLELAGNSMTEDVNGAPIDASGLGAKDALNALVQGRHPLSQLYDLGTDGPDGGKAQMVQRVVNDFRRAARDQLRQEFPELDALVSTRKADQPGRFDLGGTR